jgi:hypothetical protein
MQDEVANSNDPHLDKKGKRKRDANALRKAPQAPKRFKSSYICFFMAKQPEIKADLGDSATVTSVSKRSADLWKHLPPGERAHWDDVAAKDKQRYLSEKATYTGPWQVPWKRVKKDPSAPRRPMSAFLFYSIGKRQQIKSLHPALKNTEISRVLGEMWRGLSNAERTPFIEKEKDEREKYKVAIAEWRKVAETKRVEERKTQAEHSTSFAMHDPQLYAGEYGVPAQFLPYPPPPGYPSFRKLGSDFGAFLSPTNTHAK